MIAWKSRFPKWTDEEVEAQLAKIRAEIDATPVIARSLDNPNYYSLVSAGKMLYVELKHRQSPCDLSEKEKPNG